MSTRSDPLRAAFIVGGLTQGGAEKQLVYLAKTLHEAGVEVRVFCLTQGDHYERDLKKAGLSPIWIGAHPNPAIRMVRLIGLLRKFHPHIVQSAHFFTNLYAAIAAPFAGAISIGSIRSDPEREVRANGKWGKWLLKFPDVLLANSEAAREKAISMRIKGRKVFTLPNVIDLDGFDLEISDLRRNKNGNLVEVITVARLVSVKRLDRFIKAIDLARQKNKAIHGVIVGDGPEIRSYQSLAERLGLLPDGISFQGMQANIPEWLSGADIFVLTSEQEGFPNALLEAMAGRLPVISTPAGDAERIVQDQVTGYLIGMDDTQGLADRILDLADDWEKRRQFGLAGRRRVESRYSFSFLRDRMFEIYAAIAKNHKRTPVLKALTEISNSNITSK